MKINIKSEKFINASPPEITDEMLDWLFLTMRYTRFENDVKKVDTIDIVANQAYDGISTVHFYITINGKHKYHKEFVKGVPMESQSPPLFQYEVMGHPPQRWQWMMYFIERGVDMGEDGIECEKRWNEMMEQYEKQKEIDEKIRQKEERRKRYLELKEEFENKI